MTQQPLFHEDFEGALGTCVGALGGAKIVGVMLRPEYEKDPDKAARWLLACLNPGRDEKLSWDQTFKIMTEAKAIGCHAAMNYVTGHCGYADAQPVEADDEFAELQRQFVAATNLSAQLVSRIERLAPRVRKR